MLCAPEIDWEKENKKIKSKKQQDTVEISAEPDAATETGVMLVERPPCARRGKRCCFCLTLKVGSYLSGAYAMFLSLLGIVGCVLMLNVFLPMAVEQGKEENPGSERHIKLGASIVYWIYVIGIVIYASWFVASVVMIVGVATRIRYLLTVFTVFTSIFNVLFGLNIINALINASTTFADATGVAMFIWMIVMIILNVYATWCVSSYARELRDVDSGGVVISLAPMAPLASTGYDPPGMFSTGPSCDYYPPRETNPDFIKGKSDDDSSVENIEGVTIHLPTDTTKGC